MTSKNCYECAKRDYDTNNDKFQQKTMQDHKYHGQAGKRKEKRKRTRKKGVKEKKIVVKERKAEYIYENIFKLKQLSKPRPVLQPANAPVDQPASVPVGQPASAPVDQLEQVDQTGHATVEGEARKTYKGKNFHNVLECINSQCERTINGNFFL